jgi:hypothetical protein
VRKKIDRVRHSVDVINPLAQESTIARKGLAVLPAGLLLAGMMKRFI